MSSIDQRIVQMQFDNKGFESGVKTTLDSLKNLNENLKMKGATNGLSDVDKSIKNLGGSGLSGLSNGIDTLTSKFSALGVIGATALFNITNSAMNAGKNLAKALTIEPVFTGFQEYETKMNAIQTILTNTAHSGTTLKDVTAALDELNLYADKTIYNFAEMTKNIGTFTAAGIDLDTAVTSIKGIANLAAGSGSTPQQAATAMYQLSQALAAGKVSLMDWNSVVNAGMGGKLFQDALMETAKSMGINVDKTKSFRDTLQDGWLTADVLTKTLTQFAEDESLLQAATQVKTLTGLLDTMKESVQSGWSQSMEYIFGNKDQAAELFTALSEGFNNIIGPSADARNEMLRFWNETGGRSDVIEGLSNIIGSIGKGLSAVKKAFTEVFPPMTGKKLVELSKGFKDLTEKFKMSDKTANMIKSTFKGLFSAVDFVKNGIISLIKAFTPMTSVFSGIGAVILTVTSSIGKFFTSVNNAAKSSGVFDMMSNGIKGFISNIGKFFDNAAKSIQGFFDALSKLNFAPIFDFIRDIGSSLGGGIESIFGGIGKALGNINFNTLFAAIGALAAGKGLGTIKSIGETFKGMFDSIFGITDNVGGVLDSLRESLQAYQNNLNAGTLIKLASAVAILAVSLGILSTIDSEGMERALTGITMLFMELLGAMAILLKVAAGSNLKGFWSISSALVAFSAGVLILSVAMKNLSGLKWNEIATGLAGLVGIIGSLVVTTKFLETGTKGLMKTSIGLIVLSLAIKSMVGAVKVIGQMKPEILIKGLTGVGVMLSELALFLKVTDFNGIGIKNSVGILILAAALNVMAMAVDSFGNIDTNTMIKGLAGIGAILLELSGFVALTGNGSKIVSTSVGMIALGVALNIISKAIESMGGLSIETIGKGLISMAGSLTIIAAAVRMIPSGSLITTSVGIALMSGALLILSNALQSMGGMSWESIGKSMVTLAGSLVILATAMAFMSSGIIGASAMFIMSAALMMFIPQLVALSNLNINQVGIGLMALAGAFTVLGVAALVLTPLVPVIMSLGGAIALLGLGCVAAGVGVALFATGLATLATVGVAGALGLAEGFRQLIGLLPTLGEKLAEGLISFITTIAESVPKVVTAFGTMISGILQAFTKALPEVAKAGVALITTLCDVIGASVPKLITTGVNLILALLDGIASNIGKITTAAIDIIVNFINTIASNIGRIIQAGIDLAIGLINGLANGIRNNSPAVTAACLNLISACIGAITGTAGQFISKGSEAAGKLAQGLKNKLGEMTSAGRQLITNAINGAKGAVGGMVSVGTQMINGLINGIKSMASKVVTAAKGVVKGAIDGAKALLGIHSPSRVFAGIGKFTMMGFAKGMRDNVSMASDPAREMARSAIDNMTEPLKKVASLINGDIDATPVITPVIDLNKVEQGSKMLRQIIDENGGLQLDTNVSGGISKTIKGIQNGNDNSDLLSALYDLKKEISNVSGTTYNVNGVTYDSGSTVSAAVESLVHAAKIERRI